MSTRTRQPRGVPIGGEFANERRASCGVGLTRPGLQYPSIEAYARDAVAPQLGERAGEHDTVGIAAELLWPQDGAWVDSSEPEDLPVVAERHQYLHPEAGESVVFGEGDVEGIEHFVVSRREDGSFVASARVRCGRLSDLLGLVQTLRVSDMERGAIQEFLADRYPGTTAVVDADGSVVVDVLDGPRNEPYTRSSASSLLWSRAAQVLEETGQAEAGGEQLGADLYRHMDTLLFAPVRIQERFSHERRALAQRAIFDYEHARWWADDDEVAALIETQTYQSDFLLRRRGEMDLLTQNGWFTREGFAREMAAQRAAWESISEAEPGVDRHPVMVRQRLAFDAIEAWAARQDTFTDRTSRWRPGQDTPEVEEPPKRGFLERLLALGASR